MKAANSNPDEKALRQQFMVFVVEAQLRALEKVQRTYCTALPRKFGRLGSYRIPPEYSRTEKTLTIEVDRAVATVETQVKTGFAHRYRAVKLPATRAHCAGSTVQRVSVLVVT